MTTSESSSVRFKPADIILVKFPFTDLKNEKKRPAMILNEVYFSSDFYLYTIAMITSQVDGIQLQGDVVLNHWKDSGLLHESLLRLSKLTTIDSSLAIKKLGKIHSDDQKRIKVQLKKLMGHWIV